MVVSGRHAVRVASALVGLAAVALSLLPVVVARRLVTPPGRPTEPVRVVAVDGARGRITLSSTADSVLPGRYGFWFSGGTGYARLGPVIERGTRTVTRQLLGVDQGSLARARRGRISGWFYRSPADLGQGAAGSKVTVATQLGGAPAWLFECGERWAVLVHGRGVSRAECLRAVPVLLRQGMTVLVVSWRNDGTAPASVDRRYGMGATEWPDVESGIRYAVDRGARDVVLMGWSMGGAIVLEAATRSSLRHHVRGIMLDSPVIDWGSTLEFQCAAAGIPPPIRRAAVGLLAGRLAAVATGLAAPIRLADLDFVGRADELSVPILALHSDDDGFVPSVGSRRLAAARPDAVTLVSWSGARHTKLWNHDEERYERVITEWVERLAG